jgi:hypothetical protein
VTKGYDSDKDILKILDQATAEAKALRKDAQNGISKKVMESAMDMAAADNGHSGAGDNR